MKDSHPRRILAIACAAMICGTTSTLAQTAEVSRAQTGMITIRIDDIAEVRTVPLAAYQALVQQGVQTTVLSTPGQGTVAGATLFIPNPAPSARGDRTPVSTPGWAVGVFR